MTRCLIINIRDLGKFAWLCHSNLIQFKLLFFRAYFYFALKGVERGKNVHFHIRNMGFLRSLYSSGLRPFFRVGREGKFKRIPGKITWNVSPKFKYYARGFVKRKQFVHII